MKWKIFIFHVKIYKLHYLYRYFTVFHYCVSQTARISWAHVGCWWKSGRPHTNVGPTQLFLSQDLLNNNVLLQNLCIYILTNAFYYLTDVKSSLWFQSTLHRASIAFAMARKYIKVQTYVTESVPFTFIIVIIILN